MAAAPTRALGTLAGAGMSAAVLAVAACASESRNGDCSSRIDSAGWKRAIRQDADTETELREKVAAQLVKCQPLRGSGGAAVRRLLGHPHATVQLKGTDRRQWVYVLGPEPYGVDYQELRVEFDRRGRLVRYAIVQG